MKELDLSYAVLANEHTEHCKNMNRIAKRQRKQKYIFRSELILDAVAVGFILTEDISFPRAFGAMICLSVSIILDRVRVKEKENGR